MRSLCRKHVGEAFLGNELIWNATLSAHRRHTYIYIYIYTHIHVYIHMYIYISTERERERENERDIEIYTNQLSCTLGTRYTKRRQGRAADEMSRDTAIAIMFLHV